MKIAALFLITLCPIGVFAQTTKSSGSPSAKLIRLHYVQPDDIAHLISGLVVVAPDKALQAVVLHGNPEAVAEAERMIQQLDVPQPKTSARNVDLTVYVIGATDKPVPQTTAIPQNLEPVVRQLKAVFPYSSYSLLNSMLIRSREGKTVMTSGVLKNFPSQTAKPANLYGINYHLSPPDASVAPRTIQLSKFEFRANALYASFMTNLDLPEGQKVVVGKTDIDGGDAALFVVLSAKIE